LETVDFDSREVADDEERKEHNAKVIEDMMNREKKD